MLKAMILAAVLAVASPAIAEAQDNQVAQEMNAALQQLARQNAPYEAISNEAIAIMMDVLGKLDDANAMAERKVGKSEAERWGQSWIPQTRRKLQALETRLERLPPLDIAELERLAGGAGGMSISRIASGVRPSVRRTIGSVTDLFEVIAEHAPSAATGDELAMVRLGIAGIEGTRALVEAENYNAERAMASIGVQHPQYWLLHSIARSNEALIEVLDAAIDEALEEDFKGAPYGERVLKLSGEARESARRSSQLGQQLALEMQNDPQVRNTDLERKLVAMLRTYDQSAEVEYKVVDLLAAIGRTLVEKGSILDDMEKAMAPLESLADARARLDAGRRDMLAR